MIIALVIAVLLLSLLLVLSTFLQTLYLESLRLRAREVRALEFFRETLEEKIGRKDDEGVLVFSIIKHTSLVLLGVAYFGIAIDGRSLAAELGEAALLSWLTMVVTTYVVPHGLYRKTSGRWVLPLLPVVKLLVLLAAPLAAVLGFVRSISELGDGDGRKQEQPSPEQNIEALISAGAEEGLIEEEDKELIESVVKFGDKTLHEAMTPRPNIVAIPVDRSLEDLRQLVIHEQYSRIPVYEGSIDNVLGFVHVRDLFELSEEDRARKTIRDLLRPIEAVPETKPVSDMLREMREKGAHMAVVVDEYGSTAGLVTMEDLVEEIVGEIRDEHEPTSDVTPDGDGYIVSGSFGLDRLENLLAFRPEAETESTTVGGLIAEWLGRVPRKGESVERDGLRVEVQAGSDLRVERVRVSRAPEASQESRVNSRSQ